MQFSIRVQYSRSIVILSPTILYYYAEPPWQGGVVGFGVLRVAEDRGTSPLELSSIFNVTVNFFDQGQ